jgi:acyl-CoA thioester hydrolase
MLADSPVMLVLPVLWGDQDSFGHVNNLAYLRWAETARVDYLVRVGLWQNPPASGIGPILASVSCDYRRPVIYPDTVRVDARVTTMGNSSLRMDHTIVSEGLDAIVAEVSSTIVAIDYTLGTPVAVPDPVRKAIEALEGHAFPRPQTAGK